MAGAHASRWESLGARSPSLFLLAGVLLVGYAAFNGIDAFTGVAYERVENVFGPAGFALGFLGLLGLFPTLRGRSPKLARAGAGCAALGAVAFAVFVAVNLGEIAGVLRGEPPAWAVVFVAMAAIGMAFGYLAFAVASLRTDAHARSVGRCLLAPPAIFATMLAGSLAGGSPQWALFLISAGQALAHLAIGHTLRTGRTRIGRELPADDAIPG